MCIYVLEDLVVKAKVFISGNSQAVRIPKEFRFDAAEVEIFQRGNEVILKPQPKNLGVAFQLLTEMPSDFLADGRDDTLPQEREIF
jgi:antitoxin VapB